MIFVTTLITLTSVEASWLGDFFTVNNPLSDPVPRCCGSSGDGHCCCYEQGYEWCGNLNRCAQPWKTSEPCITRDSHGCLVTSGINWCEATQKCQHFSERCSSTQIGVDSTTITLPVQQSRTCCRYRFDGLCAYYCPENSSTTDELLLTKSQQVDAAQACCLYRSDGLCAYYCPENSATTDELLLAKSQQVDATPRMCCRHSPNGLCAYYCPEDSSTTDELLLAKSPQVDAAQACCLYRSNGLCAYYCPENSSTTGDLVLAKSPLVENPENLGNKIPVCCVYGPLGSCMDYSLYCLESSAVPLILARGQQSGSHTGSRLMRAQSEQGDSLRCCAFSNGRCVDWCMFDSKPESTNVVLNSDTESKSERGDSIRCCAFSNGRCVDWCMLDSNPESTNVVLNSDTESLSLRCCAFSNGRCTDWCM